MGKAIDHCSPGLLQRCHLLILHRQPSFSGTLLTPPLVALPTAQWFLSSRYVPVGVLVVDVVHAQMRLHLFPDIWRNVGLSPAAGEAQGLSWIESPESRTGPPHRGQPFRVSMSAISCYMRWGIRPEQMRVKFNAKAVTGW